MELGVRIVIDISLIYRHFYSPMNNLCFVSLLLTIDISLEHHIIHKIIIVDS